SPSEFRAIVDSRARDYSILSANHGANNGDQRTAPAVPHQTDFDRDVALIYSEYSSALDQVRLTEDNADQLRALAALRGEVDEKRVSVPWLSKVQLLVLDGFFDFTPIQGEMLRLLIPQIPDVIVSLNNDDSNPEIFRPFAATIDQISSMGNF